MSKYIEKTIENVSGGVGGAWFGKDLVVNVSTDRAHIKMGGWKDGQYIADSKGEAVPPIVWVEPSVKELLATEEYPVDTPLFDIIFGEIVKRMITLSDKPDGSGVNPFQGGVVSDIPEPTEA